MEPTGIPVVATDVLAVQAAPPPSRADIFRPIASHWHTLLVLTVQCLLAYRGKIRMEHLALSSVNRSTIYEQTIFFEWALMGLVLLGVWRHGSSLSTVLGGRWLSPRQVLRDLGIGLMFLLVTIVFGSVLNHGGDNSAARLLLPHGRTEMLLWIALSISAGICEEALFRGYLQRQFIAFTGNVAAGIVLSAAVFGAAHSYQGSARAVQIGLLGAMGGVLAHWCKSVRPGMFAHALQDIMGGVIRH
jgi:membrane protease YdiL (CAAX protease family)